MKPTHYLTGFPFRHGFRVEGSYIFRRFKKRHLFFQDEDSALKFLTKIENPNEKLQLVTAKSDTKRIEEEL